LETTSNAYSHFITCLKNSAEKDRIELHQSLPRSAEPYLYSAKKMLINRILRKRPWNDIASAQTPSSCTDASIQDLKPFHEMNAEKFQLKSVHGTGEFTRSLDGEWCKY